MTSEFWQWMTKFTDTHKNLIAIDEIIAYSIEKIKRIECWHYEYRHWLESFIYQAIDGINSSETEPLIHYEIKQDADGTYVHDSTDLEKTYGFYYHYYSSKTQARLAALEWVYKQEKKVKP